jgi:hypothetical protein
MTKAGFGRDIAKDKFTITLLYKLQRKSHNSHNQSDMNSTFAEDKSTNLQLLFIWKVNNEHDIFVDALLIKHSNTITWVEDTIERLHSMHLTLVKDNNLIGKTWLLNDATVLMTTLKCEESMDTFEITISEGVEEDSSMEPIWFH